MILVQEQTPTGRRVTKESLKQEVFGEQNFLGEKFERGFVGCIQVWKYATELGQSCRYGASPVTPFDFRDR